MEGEREELERERRAIERDNDRERKKWGSLLHT